MNPFQEIAVIAWAECRRALRSGRVVVLLTLYLLFSTLVLLICGALTSAIQKQVDLAVAQNADTEAVNTAMGRFHDLILGALVGHDPGVLEALVQVPVLILVVFKVTLFFLPLYVALLGFDQISGEVGPRSLRYLTVRSRRISILFGKYFAHAAVLLALILIVDVGVFGYAKLASPSFHWGALLLTFAKLWVGGSACALTYLALTTLCSASFRAPALSLAFNIFALLAFWLLDVIGKVASGVPPGLSDDALAMSPWAYVGWLSPSHFDVQLAHPFFGPYAMSLLALLLFTAVYLSAAAVMLRTRDL